MFTGSFVATVTPMKDGKVDESSLRDLLKMHLEAGTAGIVPAGCTGEAATLSSEERLRMLAVCLEEVGDAMPVEAMFAFHLADEELELARDMRHVEARAVEGRVHGVTAQEFHDRLHAPFRDQIGALDDHT